VNALQLDEIVIVGGGCYGTFYTRQLVEARKRGKVEFRRLLVVDRNPECQAAPGLVGDPTSELVVKDWDAFFDAYLGDAAEPSRRAAEPPSRPPSVIVPLTTDASPHVSVAAAAGPETVAHQDRGIARAVGGAGNAV
jgi:hypothetical protein